MAFTAEFKTFLHKLVDTFPWREEVDRLNGHDAINAEHAKDAESSEPSDVSDVPNVDKEVK